MTDRYRVSNDSELIEITSILDVREYVKDLQAVIFDMDDTLYGEKEYIKSGFRKIAELFPQIKNVEGKLWRFFLENRFAIDEFLKQEKIFSADNKEKCISIYRFQDPDIRLYSGVREMLVDLRKKFLLGLITDGRPEGQRAKIDALDLAPLLDQIIITDELGGIEYRKPNPTAYKMMAEKLNVDFSKVCYVGDNVQKDFDAPRQLGMRCIWFHNPDGLYV